MTDTQVEVGSIEEVSAPANEVDAIVRKLEATLTGDRVDHAIIGLVAFAIFLMNPQIQQDKLEEAIEATTTFAALAAMGADFQAATEESKPVDSSMN